MAGADLLAKEDFKTQIKKLLRAAELRGAPAVALVSGKIYRSMGAHAGPDSQMIACCDAMREERNEGDTIISAPKNGYGATLTIRYLLPRH